MKRTSVPATVVFFTPHSFCFWSIPFSVIHLFGRNDTTMTHVDVKVIIFLNREPLCFDRRSQQYISNCVEMYEELN